MFAQDLWVGFEANTECKPDGEVSADTAREAGGHLNYAAAAAGAAAPPGSFTVIISPQRDVHRAVSSRSSLPAVPQALLTGSGRGSPGRDGSPPLVVCAPRALTRPRRRAPEPIGPERTGGSRRGVKRLTCVPA